MNWHLRRRSNIGISGGTETSEASLNKSIDESYHLEIEDLGIFPSTFGKVSEYKFA